MPSHHRRGTWTGRGALPQRSTRKVNAGHGNAHAKLKKKKKKKEGRNDIQHEVRQPIFKGSDTAPGSCRHGVKNAKSQPRSRRNDPSTSPSALVT